MGYCTVFMATDLATLELYTIITDTTSDHELVTFFTDLVNTEVSTVTLNKVAGTENRIATAIHRK